MKISNLNLRRKYFLKIFKPERNENFNLFVTRKVIRNVSNKSFPSSFSFRINWWCRLQKVKDPQRDVDIQDVWHIPFPLFLQNSVFFLDVKLFFLRFIIWGISRNLNKGHYFDTILFQFLMLFIVCISLNPSKDTL